MEPRPRLPNKTRATNPRLCFGSTSLARLRWHCQKKVFTWRPFMTEKTKKKRERRRTVREIKTLWAVHHLTFNSAIADDIARAITVGKSTLYQLIETPEWTEALDFWGIVGFGSTTRLLALIRMSPSRCISSRSWRNWVRVSVLRAS